MLRTPGLTKPWAPVDYPIAAKVMKTALEHGASLWNGVSADFEEKDSTSTNHPFYLLAHQTETIQES